MPSHILLIEDNPANLELMTYLLQAHGFETRAAIDGQAGLEAADRETPALIICDVQLPRLSGYQVVERLKAHPKLRDVPVVAVTAFAMVDDRQKVLGAGFDGYLAKPIDPEKFVGQMRVYLKSAAPGSSVVPAHAAEAQAAPFPRGRTVLVVDDRPVNLQFAASLLEGTGYRALTAAGMAEGLRLARDAAPDLILSDIVMGDGSGYDFIRAAKADPQIRDIPFVFITSTMTGAAARQQGLALGARKFIFRPVDPQDLIREIESCFARSGDE